MKVKSTQILMIMEYLKKVLIAFVYSVFNRDLSYYSQGLSRKSYYPQGLSKKCK